MRNFFIASDISHVSKLIIIAFLMSVFSACSTIPKTERKACGDLLSSEADRVDAAYAKIEKSNREKIDLLFNPSNFSGVKKTAEYSRKSFNIFFEQQFKEMLKEQKYLPKKYRELAKSGKYPKVCQKHSDVHSMSNENIKTYKKTWEVTRFIAELTAKDKGNLSAQSYQQISAKVKAAFPKN